MGTYVEPAFDDDVGTVPDEPTNVLLDENVELVAGADEPTRLLEVDPNGAEENDEDEGAATVEKDNVPAPADVDNNGC